MTVCASRQKSGNPAMLTKNQSIADEKDKYNHIHFIFWLQWLTACRRGICSSSEKCVIYTYRVSNSVSTTTKFWWFFLQQQKIRCQWLTYDFGCMHSNDIKMNIELPAQLIYLSTSIRRDHITALAEPTSTSIPIIIVL